MKQKIKISNRQLNKIIKESIERTLNEVNDELLVNAMDRSENLNRDLGKINQQFEDLASSLSDMTGVGFSNNNTRNKELENIYYAFTELWNRFKKLYSRKQSQYSNFEDEYVNRGRPEIDE